MELADGFARRGLRAGAAARRRRRLLAAAGLAVLAALAAAVYAAGGAPPPQTFAEKVLVSEVEVVVELPELLSSARRRALRPEDFVVQEDGVLRPVAKAEPIGLPAAGSLRAAGSSRGAGPASAGREAFAGDPATPIKSGRDPALLALPIQSGRDPALPIQSDRDPSPAVIRSLPIEPPRHQVLDRAPPGGRGWSQDLPVAVPSGARRLAVCVEDLAHQLWGGTTVDLAAR